MTIKNVFEFPLKEAPKPTTPKPDFPKDVVEAARLYINKGLRVVPLAVNDKYPSLDDWQNLIFEPEDFSLNVTKEKEPPNIGIRSGARLPTEPQLIIFDCDAPEVVEMADDFLPITGAIYGRASKPRSKRLYFSDGFTKIKPFKDDEGKSLLEIRVNHQDMAPPSVHPCRELLEWEAFETIDHVPNLRLSLCGKLLSAAALIRRHYNPAGARHDWMLPLAGVFRRAGIDHKHAEYTLLKAAKYAGDTKLGDRKQEIKSTYQIPEGDAFTGATRLADEWGAEFALALRKILDDSYVDEKLQEQRELERDLKRERRIRKVRRIVDAEESGEPTFVSVELLSDQLNTEPVQFTTEDWQPIETNVVFVSQPKVGKTVGEVNYVRCLADGDPWLDSYPVTPVTGRIAILDFEMPRGQFRHWLELQNIKNKDRVAHYPLRGYGSSFNIFDDRIFERWVEELKRIETEFVFLDCLRPILDALGLNQDLEAGAFLNKFKELLAQAEIKDSLVIHHMGHNHERPMGDSGITAWADVVWFMVRNNDDARFIWANGRDVNVGEQQLSFDIVTKRLSVVGGDRRNFHGNKALNEVLNYCRSYVRQALLVVANENLPANLRATRCDEALQGPSKSEIEGHFGGVEKNEKEFSRNDIREAILRGEGENVFIVTASANGRGSRYRPHKADKELAEVAKRIKTEPKTEGKLF